MENITIILLILVRSKAASRHNMYPVSCQTHECDGDISDIELTTSVGVWK